MSVLKSYDHTIVGCYIGYVVQAIVNNFAPLLFITFQNSYGIELEKITMLITVNFGVQLLVDLLSAKFADKIGWRACMIAANLFAATFLPRSGYRDLPFCPNFFKRNFTDF